MWDAIIPQYHNFQHCWNKDMNKELHPEVIAYSSPYLDAGLANTCQQKCVPKIKMYNSRILLECKADSRLSPSQWETLLYKVTPSLISWAPT